MNVKIKTCGLFRIQDIEYANVLKPDFIGFIFAPSKRQISAATAQIFRKRLDRAIKAVGVFVDSSMDFILNLVESNIIDIIQLHNAKSEDFIVYLKSRTNAPIIKAISVHSTRDILDGVHTQADFILLDNARGGSGKCFDWEYLNKALAVGFSKPYFLAGGINSSNVASALAFKPYAIDISGGLEKNGVKNFDTMQQIINEVRNG